MQSFSFLIQKIWKRIAERSPRQYLFSGFSKVGQNRLPIIMKAQRLEHQPGVGAVGVDLSRESFPEKL